MYKWIVWLENLQNLENLKLDDFFGSALEIIFD